MKINKYWVKKRYNKTYRGTLTKRRKEINTNRAIVLLLAWCVFTTTYAYAMTSNSFVIDGAVVNGLRPSIELDAFVSPERAELETSLLEQVIIEPTVEDIKKEIIKQSREFGLNENTMLALAFCESEYYYRAKNPTSTARGVYQYLIGTWEETESAKQGLERNNYKANIREAMIDISNGESWRWPDCKIKLKAKGIYL